VSASKRSTKRKTAKKKASQKKAKKPSAKKPAARRKTVRAVSGVLTGSVLDVAISRIDFDDFEIVVRDDDGLEGNEDAALPGEEDYD